MRATHYNLKQKGMKYKLKVDFCCLAKMINSNKLIPCSEQTQGEFTIATVVSIDLTFSSVHLSILAVI